MEKNVCAQGMSGRWRYVEGGKGGVRTQAARLRTFSSNEHDAVTGGCSTGLLRGAFRELHLSFIFNFCISRFFQTLNRRRMVNVQIEVAQLVYVRDEINLQLNNEIIKLNRCCTAGFNIIISGMKLTLFYTILGNIICFQRIKSMRMILKKVRDIGSIALGTVK